MAAIVPSTTTAIPAPRRIPVFFFMPQRWRVPLAGPWERSQRALLGTLVRLPCAARPAVRAAALWLAFVAVHLWLSVAVLTGPHAPLNDVSTVYRDWIAAGAAGSGWVGLQHV